MKIIKSNIKKWYIVLVLIGLAFVGNNLFAYNCIDGCNSNTFINASDPNTLEYDNMVGLYHSTIIKEDGGIFKIWGASSASNGSSHNYTPTEITSANGYIYTGTPLKATGGSSSGSDVQFVLLTTDGLFYWGRNGYLVHNDVKGSGTAFVKSNAISTNGVSGSNSTGLPIGVAPEDVKMLFGTYQSLGIVTCSGEAYVLTQTRYMPGNGNTSSINSTVRKEWQRVQTAANTPLENVVALRGTPTAFMALTSDGEIYTWGGSTYLGDNTAAANRAYATLMTKPAMNSGAVIKMIGMTSNNSYYVLSSDGYVYSLGENSDRELGNYNNSDTAVWGNVKAGNSSTNLSNIAWISPNEHSAGDSGNKGYGAVNAITNDGKLWSWGRDSYNMLGSSSSRTDPIFMGRGLNNDDELIAVATGGHTTMVIKQCSSKFGYIGHNTTGSMGSDHSGSQIDEFSFDLTADINLCGALAHPPKVVDLKICFGETALISNANMETDPSLVEWHVADDRNSDIIEGVTQVGPGTYYAFFKDDSGRCLTGSSEMTVSYLEAGDPGYEECFGSPSDDFAQTNQNTPVSGNVLDNDGDLFTKVTAAEFDGNPLVVDGSTENPLVIGGVTYGTIVIDEDGSFTFTPAEDYTGNVPTITYTASNDDETVFDSANLDIKVLPVYDPLDNNLPVAYDDIVYTEKGEDASGNVLTNDSDPDGDEIKVTEVVILDEDGNPQTHPVSSTDTTIPVHDKNGDKIGELTIKEDGEFTFTPEPDFVGEVPPIEYTIDDGNGGTDTADLNVVVTEEPHTEMTDIIANDDLNSAPQGVAMDGDVSTNDLWTGTDPEITVAVAKVNGVETPLTIGADTPIKDGNGDVIATIKLNEDGTYDYTPKPDFVGNVYVDYTVENDEGNEDSATLTLTSTPIKPVAMDDINQTPQGIAVDGNVLVNDISFNGNLIVDRIIVNGAGNVPVVVSTPASGKTTPVNIYAENGVDVIGTIAIDKNGNYTFDPADGFTGNVPDINYVVKDEKGSTDEATLGIKVIPTIDPYTNNPPIAQDDVILTEKGTSTTGNLLNNDSDPDGDPLKVIEITVYDDTGTPTNVPVPPGTPVTVDVHDEDGNKIGELTVDSDGSFTFVPENDFVGEVPPISYEVCDGAGECDDADLKITVVQEDVIGDVVANDDADSAPKGHPMNGNVKVNDDWGDPLKNPKVTGGTVTIDGTTTPLTPGTAVNIPDVGTIKINPDGTYSFNPDPDFVGTVPVKYTVINDDGEEDSATLYLTSLPVELQAIDDMNQTPQSTAVSGNVLDNDKGEELSVESATYMDAAGAMVDLSLNTPTTVYGYDKDGLVVEAGTVKLKDDGSYEFSPKDGFIGKVPIDYTAEDKFGYEDDATLVINVVPNIDPIGNNPPVANPDHGIVQKGNTITIKPLGNDSDPDGDVVTVTDIKFGGTSISTDSSNPTTIIYAGETAGTAYRDSNGNLVFKADDDYTGEMPPFEYTISDGKGGTDSSTITVKVTNIPTSLLVANDDNNTAPKGKTMTGNVQDNDTWGGTTPELTEITILDNTGTPVDVPLNGTPQTIDVHDEDGDKVGELTINPDGSYIFVPEPEFVGTVPVKYTVTNNEGDEDSAIVYLTSLPVKPLAKNDINQTPVNETVNGNVLTNDKGDAIDVTGAKYMNSSGVMVTLPLGTETTVYGYDKHGTVVPAGKMTLEDDGTYTFKSEYANTKEVPFEYTITDKYGYTDNAKLNIQVIPMSDPLKNEPPVANDDNIKTKKNKPVTVNILTNDKDPDNDPLTATEIKVPGPGGSTTTVTIPETGTPPTTDVYGPTGDKVGKITVYPNGETSFTPEPGYTGEVPPIVYTVCDNASPKACDTGEINITVENKSDADNVTYANDDAKTGLTGETLSGNVLANDNDPEGDTQTLTGVTIGGVNTPITVPNTPIVIPDKGTLTISPNGNYSFVPESGFEGTVVVEQTVCDNGTPIACDNATLYLTTMSNQCAPIAKDDINQTQINMSVSGNMLTNDYGLGNAVTRIDVEDQDVAVDPVTGATITITGKGTLHVDSNGDYTFTPVNNFTGNVGPIRYEVSSSCGEKAQADLNIKVIPRIVPGGDNNPPVAHNDNATTDKNTDLTGNLTGNDNDPDGDDLVVTKINGTTVPSGGVTIDVFDPNDPTKKVGELTVTPDGNYTYHPTDNTYTGKVGPIVYQVCDDGTPSLCDTAELRIEVTDKPMPETSTVIANDDTNSAPKGTTMNGNVSTNDDYSGGTDAKVVLFTYLDNVGTTQTVVVPTTGATVTIYDSKGEKAGSLTLNQNGVYEFVPEPGYVGTASVVYTVRNDEGDEDRATLYLTPLGAPETRVWVGDIDTDWKKTGNWKDNIVPEDGDDIVFATTANNPYDASHPYPTRTGKPAQEDLYVPTDKEYTINDLTNESDKALVVPPVAVIIVEGDITGFDTKEKSSRLVIDADSDPSDGLSPNGSFIAPNQCGKDDVFGTIKLFAQGQKVDKDVKWNDALNGSPTSGAGLSSSHSWQHFGVPAEGVVALDAFEASWIQWYSEPQNGNFENSGKTGTAVTFYDKWNYVKPYETLELFKGYEITQDAPTVYTIKGRLTFCDKELTMSRKAVAVDGATGDNIHYGLGQNVFGNSYAAAINVDKGLEFNSTDIEQTVYLYRTGSFQEWGSNIDEVNGDTPNAGSYIAIPVNTADVVWDRQIPSMQGFLLKFTPDKTTYMGSDETVTLKYANEGVVGNKRPQLAPEAPKSYLSVTMTSESTVDKLWLFSQEGTSDTFDNGWDGFKYYGTPTAFIYSESPQGPLQVNTSNTIDGKVLSIMPNDDKQYSLKISKNNLDDYSDLHLVDLVARKVTPLTGNETIYNFVADHAGKRVKRFIILNSKDVDFDKLSQLDGYLQNNNELVMNNLTTKTGVAYLVDAAGKLITTKQLQTGVNREKVNLLPGVYILRLEAAGQQESVKLIVK